jgi:hypothetical protein
MLYAFNTAKAAISKRLALFVGDFFVSKKSFTPEYLSLDLLR